MEDLNLLLSKFQCQIDTRSFVYSDLEALGDKIFYGVELEYIYAPDVARMSCIAFLIGQDMLTIDDLRQTTLNRFAYISPLQMEALKRDGENDELVLTPMTLLAYQQLLPHYQVLFASLKQQGFEPWGPLNEIGLHISIDKVFPAETIRRFLWWLFYNNKFFVWMSGRRNYSTIRSDIWHILGDKYHTWDAKVREEVAEDQFSFFVNAYDIGTYANVAGIRTYADRDYFQLTHFGSTLDADEFLSKIEFVDVLLNWCLDREDYNVNNFLRSIDPGKHNKLFESLKSLNL